MAAKHFSLLRNFSAAKFYSVAKQGAMPVSVPRSFGILMALGNNLAGNEIALFDAVLGNGITIGQSLAGGQSPIIVYDGGDPFGAPMSALSGIASTINLTGGANPAGNAYTANEQTLLNEFASIANGNAPVTGGGGGATTQAFLTPQTQRAFLIVVVEKMVGPDAVWTLYINGQQVGQQVYTPVSAQTGSVYLGKDAGNLAPALTTLIGGWFMHAAPLAADDVSALWQACSQAKDIVSPAGYTLNGDSLDYIWSVKQQNFDARALWPSVGAQAPVSMVRNGVWTPTGPGADVIALDLPWA